MPLGHSTLQKIVDYERLEDIRAAHQHQTIAFASGCYDLLQPGHAVFFEQAKQYADVLVVGLGSDRVIKELKGPTRPVNPEHNRAYLVASLSNVDYVVINDESLRPGKINFSECLKRLRPDYFVLTDDDSAVKQKQALCRELDIKLELVKRVVPGYLTPTSTTEIIQKSRQS